MTDGGGDHGGDAGHGDDQGQRREKPQQNHGQPPRRGGAGAGLGQRPEVLHRLLRVDGVDGGPHLRAQVQSVRARPHQHAGGRARPLQERSVELIRRLAVEPVVTHVADDADDGEPGLAVVQRDPLFERTPALPPVALGQRPADDSDRDGLRVVEPRERPAGQQRHADRREVVRADDARFELGTQIGVLVGPPLDGEPLLLAHLARHREAVGDRCRGQSGPVPQPLQHVGEKLAAALRRRVLRPVGKDLRGQHVLGIEPGIDLLQPVEAGQEQPAGDQQHEGGGHLRGGQQAAHAAPGRRVGGLRSRLLQRHRHVASSRQGRRAAEHDPGQQRQAERERQHPTVDRHLRGAGREERREGDQQIEAEPGHQQPEGAGGKSQQARLRHQLPQQARPARAEGRPEGELALAAAHSRQREIGDIRACDQQHKHGRGQQDQQRGPRLARQFVGQRQGDGGVARIGGIGLGKVALQPGRHGGQLRPEAVDAHARPEPAERGHAAERGAVLLHPGLGAGAERAGRRRHVDVVLTRILRHRGQYADHGVRPVVHLEDLPDDARVAAEALPPVRVAEHQHRLGPEIVVAVAERPAVERLHAEHVEEVRRHHPGQHAVRLAPVEQGERHAVVLDEAVERRELLPVVADLLDREGDVRRAGPLRLLAGEHELVPVGIRQRPQQHAVDEAEDGGVGADAEPEGDHHHQAVARRPEQRSHAVPHVPNQRFQHRFRLVSPGARRASLFWPPPRQCAVSPSPLRQLPVARPRPAGSLAPHNPGVHDTEPCYPPPRARTATTAMVTQAAAPKVITMPTFAMSRIEK